MNILPSHKKHSKPFVFLNSRKGFTFVEIIIVILIISVITGAVGISVQNVNSTVRLSNAASRALADIKELQEIAINERKNVSVVVNPGNDSYYLYVDGSLYRQVTFNEGDYVGVNITSSNFSGPLTFDTTGQPSDNYSTYDGERIFMNLNNGYAEIQVFGTSGLVTVDIADWTGGCGGWGC